MLGQYKNGTTQAIPSGHFLKSIEMQSVNSWVSLPPLRALAPYSTCKAPSEAFLESSVLCLLIESVLGPMSVFCHVSSGTRIPSLLVCANMRVQRQ